MNPNDLRERARRLGFPVVDSSDLEARLLDATPDPASAMAVPGRLWGSPRGPMLDTGLESAERSRAGREGGTMDDDAVRLLGGPHDGAEFDADDLFGGRLPGGLAIASRVRVAYYDLDIDAAGPLYRFAGWQASPVRAIDPR